MKMKSQKKYSMVIISIELNEQPLRLWNRRTWMTPLEGLLVRWYLANWNLAQRKKRERFQAVVKNLPETVTPLTLYPEDPTQSPILYLGCKYFKIMQERNTRKLITYYERWEDLDKVTGKEINLQEYTGV